MSPQGHNSGWAISLIGFLGRPVIIVPQIADIAGKELEMVEWVELFPWVLGAIGIGAWGGAMALYYFSIRK